jgi:DNA-binding winged helix-turn-helix (wHTH) protein/tetratricopeptide (TPR) repeat protein
LLTVKNPSLFFLGDWQVNPSTNTLRKSELVKQLEPKAMDVLLLLCAQQGQVLSADDIATQCWGGMDIGDNPVHKAITQLRKALNDKPSAPIYIETIRKRGYHIIAKLDFPLDDELKAEQNSWQGASPFPGLVAFEAKDAQVFFGRNAQIATLLERISKQVIAQHTFCLILGPSGTGKSSLVNAGLLPTLTGPNGYNGFGVVSHTSIDFADISHDQLFVDLASAMLDWDVNDQPVFAGKSAESLAEQLQSNGNAAIEQCTEALKKTQQRYNKPQFLLFIDRLEVLLSSPVFSDDERVEFLDLIEKLATCGAVIVISACRNDFYPTVVNHPSLMANKGSGGHFDLLAPTRAELMQMIRLPAVAANLTWSVDENSATALDQILCAEAANNPDALPMLQYTLQELYLQRSESDELQVSVYKALGGIEGAIGKKAEEIYQQLPAEHQPQLATVLSRLVILSPDGETITSRAARWSQLPQISEIAFVQAMVDSRLFVSHLQNGEPCFSLAHEALLRRWPRASEWISVHKDSLTIKSRLQQLSERWLKEDKSSAYLLPQGKPLEEALSLQDMPVFVLGTDELALLNASQKKIKTKRWLTRSTITLLCFLTFIAIFMSVKSQQSESFAQQKRLDAESLLGFMVGEFADKLRSVKRMDLLDGISNKALEYFSDKEIIQKNSLFTLSNQSLNRKSQFQHAQTLQAMGEVAYSRGKNDEAEQAFSSAELLLNTLLLEDQDNLEVLTKLGLNAFWAGQLAFDAGRLLTAQNAFSLYLDSSEKMLKLIPDDLDTQMEVAYAHIALGSVSLSRKLYQTARESFELSLNMTNEVLSSREGDLTVLTVRTDIFSWIATTEQHLGHLTKALNIHQRAQAELEIVHSNAVNNANFLEPLAYSHWHQARILHYRGDHLSALNMVLKAIEYFDSALSQDPDNVVWKQRRLTVQVLQKQIEDNLKNTRHSELDKEIQSQLLTIQDETIVTPLLLVELTRYLQNISKWNKSAEFLKRTEIKINQHNSQDKLALVRLTLLKARQNNNQRNEAVAFTQCQKAITLLQPLLQKSKNYEYLILYVQARRCLDQFDPPLREIKSLKAMGISDFNL